MKNSLMVLFTLALVLGISGIASADELIVNGSFDDGLNNWNTVGDVIIGNDGILPSFVPLPTGMDGDFALFGFNNWAGPGTHSISQTFDVAGATSAILSFDYLFAYIDGSEWCLDPTDTIAVLLDNDNHTVLASITYESVTSEFSSGTVIDQSFVLNVPLNNVNELVFMLTQDGAVDMFGNPLTESFAAVDNVSLVTCTPVPEPTLLLLLGIGVGAATLASRRMK